MIGPPKLLMHTHETFQKSNTSSCDDVLPFSLQSLRKLQFPFFLLTRTPIATVIVFMYVDMYTRESLPPTMCQSFASFSSL